MAWKQNDPTAFDAEGAVSMSQVVAERIRGNLIEHTTTRLRKASAVFPAGMIDFDALTDDPIDYTLTRFGPHSGGTGGLDGGTQAECAESIGLQVSTLPSVPVTISLPFAFSSYATAVRIRITATVRNHGTGGGVQIVPLSGTLATSGELPDTETYSTALLGGTNFFKFEAASLAAAGGIDIATGDVAGSSTYCYYETTLDVSEGQRGSALEIPRRDNIRLVVLSYLDPTEAGAGLPIGAVRGGRYVIEPTDYFAATGLSDVMPGPMHCMVMDSDSQEKVISQGINVVVAESSKTEGDFLALFDENISGVNGAGPATHVHLPRLVISAITIEEVNE